MTDFREQFKRLLENTYISGKGSEQEIYNKMTSFLNTVIDNTPERLFRFRNLDAGEYTLKSFEEGTISLCKANRFSDKYDSVIFVDVEKEVDTMETHLKNAMADVIKEIKKKNPNIRAEKAANVCYYLEQGMTENQIIDKIVGDDYSHYLDELRKDLNRGVLRYRDSMNTARIACFTENVQSKFMWDTYAGGYQGFALEYNLKDYFIKSLNQLRNAYVFPIIYSDEKPDLTRDVVNNYAIRIMKEKGWHSLLNLLRPFIDVNLLYPHKPFLYKDKEEYSHEKEWRMLYYDLENKEDFIDIPDEGCLRAIYYGMDISSDNYEKLHQIALKKGIREYKVSIDNHSKNYSLAITLI